MPKKSSKTVTKAKRSEAVSLIALLLALNGLFIAGYVLSLSNYEPITSETVIRLLPELATMVMASLSAYGLWKMRAWGTSSATLAIGMIAYSVLDQIREYTVSSESLVYWIVPLGIITAAVYFWRRKLFLSA